MIRILFICHGNICRSPMAEFIMKKIIAEDEQLKHMDIEVFSAAVSDEEAGNDMYPPAKAKLKEKHVPFERRKARRIRREDYENYDLLIGMDDSNLYRMYRFFPEEPSASKDIPASVREGKKIFSLSAFYGSNRGIADPWYTDDFETAYRDIERGCLALAEILKMQ